MTEKEVLKMVDKKYLDEIREENCEPTNRVLPDGDLEWSSSVRAQTKKGDEITLLMYYVTTEDERKTAEEMDDYGAIAWADRIAGYEISYN